MYPNSLFALGDAEGFGSDSVKEFYERGQDGQASHTALSEKMTLRGTHESEMESRYWELFRKMFSEACCINSHQIKSCFCLKAARAKHIVKVARNAKTGSM